MPNITTKHDAQRSNSRLVVKNQSKTKNVLVSQPAHFSPMGNKKTAKQAAIFTPKQFETRKPQHNEHKERRSLISVPLSVQRENGFRIRHDGRSGHVSVSHRSPHSETTSMKPKALNNVAVHLFSFVVHKKETPQNLASTNCQHTKDRTKNSLILSNPLSCKTPCDFEYVCATAQRQY